MILIDNKNKRNKIIIFQILIYIFIENKCNKNTTIQKLTIIIYFQEKQLYNNINSLTICLKINVKSIVKTIPLNINYTL